LGQCDKDALCHVLGGVGVTNHAEGGRINQINVAMDDGGKRGFGLPLGVVRARVVGRFDRSLGREYPAQVKSDRLCSVRHPCRRERAWIGRDAWECFRAFCLRAVFSAEPGNPALRPTVPGSTTPPSKPIIKALVTRKFALSAADIQAIQIGAEPKRAFGVLTFNSMCRIVAEDILPAVAPGFPARRKRPHAKQNARNTPKRLALSTLFPGDTDA